MSVAQFYGKDGEKYGEPPAVCSDPGLWYQEQRSLETINRVPSMAIKPSERYAECYMALMGWTPATTRFVELEKDGVTCPQCEGHGAYNLRRSALWGYMSVMCWMCGGYRKVKP